MNGKEILSAIVQERLRELKATPLNIRQEGGGRIYAFCLGAADALIKAGLLTAEDATVIMTTLGTKLEQQGLGHRMTERFEIRRKTQFDNADDEQSEENE